MERLSTLNALATLTTAPFGATAAGEP